MTDGRVKNSTGNKYDAFPWEDGISGPKCQVSTETQGTEVEVQVQVQIDEYEQSIPANAKARRDYELLMSEKFLLYSFQEELVSGQMGKKEMAKALGKCADLIEKVLVFLESSKGKAIDWRIFAEEFISELGRERQGEGPAECEAHLEYDIDKGEWVDLATLMPCGTVEEKELGLIDLAIVTWRAYKNQRLRLKEGEEIRRSFIEKRVLYERIMAKVGSKSQETLGEEERVFWNAAQDILEEVEVEMAPDLLCLADPLSGGVALYEYEDRMEITDGSKCFAVYNNLAPDYVEMNRAGLERGHRIWKDIEEFRAEVKGIEGGAQYLEELGEDLLVAVENKDWSRLSEISDSFDKLIRFTVISKKLDLAKAYSGKWSEQIKTRLQSAFVSRDWDEMARVEGDLDKVVEFLEAVAARQERIEFLKKFIHPNAPGLKYSYNDAEGTHDTISRDRLNSYPLPQAYERLKHRLGRAELEKVNAAWDFIVRDGGDEALLAGLVLDGEIKDYGALRDHAEKIYDELEVFKPLVVEMLTPSYGLSESFQKVVVQEAAQLYALAGLDKWILDAEFETSKNGSKRITDKKFIDQKELAVSIALETQKTRDWLVWLLEDESRYEYLVPYLDAGSGLAYEEMIGGNVYGLVASNNIEERKGKIKKRLEQERDRLNDLLTTPNEKRVEGPLWLRNAIGELKEVKAFELKFKISKVLWDTKNRSEEKGKRVTTVMVAGESVRVELNQDDWERGVRTLAYWKSGPKGPGDVSDDHILKHVMGEYIEASNESEDLDAPMGAGAPAIDGVVNERIASLRFMEEEMASTDEHNIGTYHVSVDAVKELRAEYEKILTLTDKEERFLRFNDLEQSPLAQTVNKRFETVESAEFWYDMWKGSLVTVPTMGAALVLRSGLILWWGAEFSATTLGSTALLASEGAMFTVSGAAMENALDNQPYLPYEDPVDNIAYWGEDYLWGLATLKVFHWSEMPSQRYQSKFIREYAKKSLFERGLIKSTTELSSYDVMLVNNASRWMTKEFGSLIPKHIPLSTYLRLNLTSTGMNISSLYAGMSVIDYAGSMKENLKQGNGWDSFELALGAFESTNNALRLWRVGELKVAGLALRPLTGWLSNKAVAEQVKYYQGKIAEKSAEFQKEAGKYEGARKLVSKGEKDIAELEQAEMEVNRAFAEIVGLEEQLAKKFPGIFDIGQLEMDRVRAKEIGADINKLTERTRKWNDIIRTANMYGVTKAEDRGMSKYKFNGATEAELKTALEECFPGAKIITDPNGNIGVIVRNQEDKPDLVAVFIPVHPELVEGRGKPVIASGAKQSPESQLDPKVDDPKAVEFPETAGLSANFDVQPASWEASTKAYVVIVDPYSTAKQFEDQFAKLGYGVIYVHSAEQLPAWYGTPRDDALTYRGDIRKLAGQLRDRHVVAVINGTDYALDVADRLAEELNVPHNNPTLSRARREKYKQVQALQSQGIAVPETIASGNLEEMLQWAGNRNKWPVVIKPTEACGSEGVFICQNEADIRHAYNSLIGQKTTEGIPIDKIIVQEFLEGDEYIVDIASSRGKHYVTDVWRYHKKAVQKPDGGTTYIREYNDLLSVSDVDSALLEYAKDATTALGVDNGPSHLEIIMTKDGPRLVELNPRIVGAGLPKYVEAAGGMNPTFLAAVGLVEPDSMGRYASDVSGQQKSGRMVRLISTQSGKIKSVQHLEELRKLKTYSSDHVFQPGDILLPTVDLDTCPGTIFLTGDPGQIERDYQQIRQWEKDGFFVVEDPQNKIHSGNHYVTNLGLQDYEYYLGEDFAVGLRFLTSKDHWVDLGAGDASAMTRYMKEDPDAPKMTAIGLQQPDSRRLAKELENNPDQFRYLSGQSFEQTPPDQIGKAQLVTDLIGVYSYTKELDVTMQRTLEITDPQEGQVHLLISIEADPLQQHFNSFKDPIWHSHKVKMLTILDAEGKEIRLIDWFKSIEGVEVISTEEFVDKDATTSVRIALKRNGKPIRIPKLKLVEFYAGRPSNRKFQLTGDYIEMPADRVAKDVSLEMFSPATGKPITELPKPDPNGVADDFRERPMSDGSEDAGRPSPDRVKVVAVFSKLYPDEKDLDAAGLARDITEVENIVSGFDGRILELLCIGIRDVVDLMVKKGFEKRMIVSVIRFELTSADTNSVALLGVEKAVKSGAITKDQTYNEVIGRLSKLAGVGPIPDVPMPADITTPGRQGDQTVSIPFNEMGVSRPGREKRMSVGLGVCTAVVATREVPGGHETIVIHFLPTGYSIREIGSDAVSDKRMHNEFVKWAGENNLPVIGDYTKAVYLKFMLRVLEEGDWDITIISPEMTNRHGLGPTDIYRHLIGDSPFENTPSYSAKNRISLAIGEIVTVEPDGKIHGIVVVTSERARPAAVEAAHPSTGSLQTAGGQAFRANEGAIAELGKRYEFKERDYRNIADLDKYAASKDWTEAEFKGFVESIFDEFGEEDGSAILFRVTGFLENTARSEWTKDEQIAFIKNAMKGSERAKANLRDALIYSGSFLARTRLWGATRQIEIMNMLLNNSQGLNDMTFGNLARFIEEINWQGWTIDEQFETIKYFMAGEMTSFDNTCYKLRLAEKALAHMGIGKGTIIEIFREIAGESDTEINSKLDRLIRDVVDEKDATDGAHTPYIVDQTLVKALETASKPEQEAIKSAVVNAKSLDGLIANLRTIRSGAADELANRLAAARDGRTDFQVVAPDMLGIKAAVKELVYRELDKNREYLDAGRRLFGATPNGPFEAYRVILAAKELKAAVDGARDIFEFIAIFAVPVDGKNIWEVKSLDDLKPRNWRNYRLKDTLITAMRLVKLASGKERPSLDLSFEFNMIGRAQELWEKHAQIFDPAIGYIPEAKAEFEKKGEYSELEKKRARLYELASELDENNVISLTFVLEGRRPLESLPSEMQGEVREYMEAVIKAAQQYGEYAPYTEEYLIYKGVSNLEARYRGAKARMEKEGTLTPLPSPSSSGYEKIFVIYNVATKILGNENISTYYEAQAAIRDAVEKDPKGFAEKVKGLSQTEKTLLVYAYFGEFNYRMVRSKKDGYAIIKGLRRLGLDFEMTLADMSTAGGKVFYLYLGGSRSTTTLRYRKTKSRIHTHPSRPEYFEGDYGFTARQSVTDITNSIGRAVRNKETGEDVGWVLAEIDGLDAMARVTVKYDKNTKKAKVLVEWALEEGSSQQEIEAFKKAVNDYYSNIDEAITQSWVKAKEDIEDFPEALEFESRFVEFEKLDKEFDEEAARPDLAGELVDMDDLFEMSSSGGSQPGGEKTELIGNLEGVLTKYPFPSKGVAEARLRELDTEVLRELWKRIKPEAEELEQLKARQVRLEGYAREIQKAYDDELTAKYGDNPTNEQVEEVLGLYMEKFKNIGQRTRELSNLKSQCEKRYESSIYHANVLLEKYGLYIAADFNGPYLFVRDEGPVSAVPATRPVDMDEKLVYVSDSESVDEAREFLADLGLKKDEIDAVIFVAEQRASELRDESLTLEILKEAENSVANREKGPKRKYQIAIDAAMEYEPPEAAATETKPDMSKLPAAEVYQQLFVDGKRVKKPDYAGFKKAFKEGSYAEVVAQVNSYAKELFGPYIEIVDAYERGENISGRIEAKKAADEELFAISCFIDGMRRFSGLKAELEDIPQFASSMARVIKIFELSVKEINDRTGVSIPEIDAWLDGLKKNKDNPEKLGELLTRYDEIYQKLIKLQQDLRWAERSAKNENVSPEVKEEHWRKREILHYFGNKILITDGVKNNGKPVEALASYVPISELNPFVMLESILLNFGGWKLSLAAKQYFMSVISNELPPERVGDIYRIVINMINNAIREGASGEIDIWRPAKGNLTENVPEAVRKNPDEYVVFFVKDNGPGIPADVAEKIKRGEMLKDPAMPMRGQGLVNARNIIFGLGGEMWFETTDGQGTTFYVALPKGDKKGPSGKGPDIDGSGPDKTDGSPKGGDSGAGGTTAFMPVPGVEEMPKVAVQGAVDDVCKTKTNPSLKKGEEVSKTPPGRVDPKRFERLDGFLRVLVDERIAAAAVAGRKETYICVAAHGDVSPYSIQLLLEIAAEKKKDGIKIVVVSSETREVQNNLALRYPEISRAEERGDLIWSQHGFGRYPKGIKFNAVIWEHPNSFTASGMPTLFENLEKDAVVVMQTDLGYLDQLKTSKEWEKIYSRPVNEEAYIIPSAHLKQGGEFAILKNRSQSEPDVFEKE